MARPIKLWKDKELYEGFLHLLNRGYSIKMACRKLKLAHRTICYYIQYGKEAEEKIANGEKLNKKERGFYEFLHKVEEARAKNYENLHCDIMKGTRDDPAFALRVASIRFPKEWGVPKKGISVTQNNDNSSESTGNPKYNNETGETIQDAEVVEDKVLSQKEMQEKLVEFEGLKLLVTSKRLTMDELKIKEAEGIAEIEKNKKGGGK